MIKKSINYPIAGVAIAGIEPALLTDLLLQTFIARKRANSIVECPYKSF
jgi:hypothetical protein